MGPLDLSGPCGTGNWEPPESGGPANPQLAAIGKKISSSCPKPESGDRLEAERVRLFVNAPGGVPAPPYGSWWIEGTLSGRTTEQVADRYLAEGLQIQHRTGPADYLPTELEFLSFLLHHQLAARMTGAEDLERESREREQDFLRLHMRNWIPAFCRAGRAATHEPYWKAVFDAAECFVEGGVGQH